MPVAHANVPTGGRPRDVLRRSTIVALVSFLTLIDLFGSQALLPRLGVAFEADPATMGFAVNAWTFGMALSGLVVGAVLAGMIALASTLSGPASADRCDAP